MEDESSSDVIAIDAEESQGSAGCLVKTKVERTALLADRPLMQFFKRLVFNKHSQNTMLTNAQLEEILKKEFSLGQLHTLEVDIYVTVLKKYLKEWPMWDTFETTTRDLTEDYNQTTFVSMLEEEYNNIKSYLKAKLEMAVELSSQVVTKIKNSEKTKLKAPSVNEESKSSSSDPAGVVLEIEATRDQLNKLIYRRPHTRFNNTIFNVDDKPPTHIRVNTLSLESILNWWSVKIKITLQSHNVFLSRETTHELKHVLCNHPFKAASTSAPVALNEEIQMKETKKMKHASTKHILACLDLLSSDHDAAVQGMDVIINHVRHDILGMSVVAGPAYYKRYLNKYPYERFLYSESESDEKKYDIQLKETVSPMHLFYVGRLDFGAENTLPPQWLEVECMSCGVVFSGQTLVEQLMQHFDLYHQAEPDWQCTNCYKCFPMAELAANWWHHKCE